MEETTVQPGALLSTYIRTVFSLFAAALGITGLVAFYVSQTPILYNTLIQHSALLILIFLVQLAIALTLSTRVCKLGYGTLSVLLYLYAATIGLTFSTILLAFDIKSLYLAFFTSCGMFLTMALYGYYTTIDFSAWRSFFSMGLIGLIIAMVLHGFTRGSTTDLVISCVGVILFAGLTALDMQRIKTIYDTLACTACSRSNIAVYGALMLYLDFINLFLFTTHLVGRRK